MRRANSWRAAHLRWSGDGLLPIPLTPVGAAQRLMESGRGDFLLESVEGGENRGRYSLLGLAPGPRVSQRCGAGCDQSTDWADDRDAFAPSTGRPIEALAPLVADCRIDVPDGLPPALACLVGYFGYETIGLVEDIARAPASELDLPDMLFVRPTLLLVFDNAVGRAVSSSRRYGQATGDPEQAAGDGGRADRRRLAHAGRAIRAPCRAHRSRLAGAGPDAADCANGDYRAMVAQAKEYIVAGDIFQVVLAQRFTCPFPLPPLRALSRTAAREPLALPLFPRPARFRRGRVQPRNPGSRPRWRSDHPPHRRNPPARRDAARPTAQPNASCWPIRKSVPST